MAHWTIKGNTEKHRVCKAVTGTHTHTSNDRKDDTTSKQIRTHIKQLIQNEGDVVNTMNDGYCMYRSTGKYYTNKQVK